jgi:hypothetical protein
MLDDYEKPGEEKRKIKISIFNKKCYLDTLILEQTTTHSARILIIFSSHIQRNAKL